MKDNAWMAETLEDMATFAELNHMYEFAMELRHLRAKHHAMLHNLEAQVPPVVVSLKLAARSTGRTRR